MITFPCSGCLSLVGSSASSVTVLCTTLAERTRRMSIPILLPLICLFDTRSSSSPVELAWTQVLNGLGGGISIVCVNVMVQASVPHEDLGIVIANLALWTKLTGAISAAVAGAVWT